jgi:hypothetical protein
MLKQRKGSVGASTTPNYSDNSVRIAAGSVVIENSWVNYNSALFKLTDYISSVVKPPRTRFFQNRGYAVYLLVGLDINEGIKTVEGRQVPFTTVWSVPRPETHDIVPLVGLVVVQDGSNDLNNGYVPLKDEYIEFFNGAGNVVDSGLKGITGVDSDVSGSSGAGGYTGVAGAQGFSGWPGGQGHSGIVPPAPQGETGTQGMTGINWQVEVPLKSFFYV